MVNRLRTKLNNKVLVKGMNHSRPKSLKWKSPGNLPKPIFSNQGRTQLMSNSAKKTTISQRSIVSLKPMAAVTRCKALGLPVRVRGKTNYLEQFTHFVLADEFHGLSPLGESGFRHFFSQPQVE